MSHIFEIADTVEEAALRHDDGKTRKTRSPSAFVRKLGQVFRNPPSALEQQDPDATLSHDDRLKVELDLIRNHTAQLQRQPHMPAYHRAHFLESIAHCCKNIEQLQGKRAVD